MNYTQNERIAQVGDNTLVVGMILIDPYTIMAPGNRTRGDKGMVNMV